MTWITAQDVADYLDLPGPDARMTAEVEAVADYVESVRSDLDYQAVPPRVKRGAVALAAERYQRRSAPSGFAGYGDGADLYEGLSATARSDIYRLLGIRRPLAA